MGEWRETIEGRRKMEIEVEGDKGKKREEK